MSDPAPDSPGHKNRLGALRQQQEEGWRLGRPIPVEELLRDTSRCVLDDEDAVLELILAEAAHRARRGESVTARDYSSSFPHLVGRLDRLLTLENLLGRNSALHSRESDSSTPFLIDGDASTETNPALVVRTPPPLQLQSAEHTSEKEQAPFLPDSETMTSTIHESPQGRPPSFPFSRIGNYEILEEIARGGMGVVYKARQRGINRIVALKVVMAGKFAHDAERLRFQAEVRAAGRLDHPHIVPIYDVGEHEQLPYYSMAYIDGGSLKDLTSAGPIAPRRAAELMKTISDAVHYAHHQGVIHRDLKPANILVDSNGQPRITDFGLAKQTHDDASLTATGQVLGTPAYMSPEQAKGNNREVGPTSDVYSLGATLYYMLTGQPPFRAETLYETLIQVQQSVPTAPRKLNPEVPFDLETIVLKCIQKAPSMRYDSAESLAADLTRFLRDEPVLARRTDTLVRAMRFIRRKPAEAVLVLLCVIAAGFLMRFMTFGMLRAVDFLMSLAPSLLSGFPLPSKHNIWRVLWIVPFWFLGSGLTVWTCVFFSKCARYASTDMRVSLLEILSKGSGALAVLWVETSYIPRFKKVFYDFGVNIPLDTAVTICVSNSCVDYINSAITLVGVYILASVLIVVRMRRGLVADLFAARWSKAFAIFVAIGLAAPLLSLLRPLIQLVNDLS